jgi:formylglycine-generating enzyme required for sulfatase activity
MVKLEHILNEAQATGHWNVKVTSVETRNAYNETPLHFFCRRGNLNAVQILIDAGADVNVEGEKLATPIYYAMAFENFEIVNLLLMHGANREVNLFGVKRSLLDCAISKALQTKSLASEKIVQLLKGPEPKRVRFTKKLTSSLAKNKVSTPKFANSKKMLKQVGEIFTDFSSAPELVVLPTGSFLMGTSDRPYFNDSVQLPPHTSNINHLMFLRCYSAQDQSPQHMVNINYHLAISQFPITFEQWDYCLADRGTNYKPSDNGWGRGKRPVINLDWSDANEYLRWLNKNSGIDEDDPTRYRLPTEAEWEFACRAGTEGYFNTSSGQISDNEACYDASSVIEGLSSIAGKKHDRTIEVGTYAPNAWGLYDMHGNVMEMVDGSYESNYLLAKNDGSALETGSSSWVKRGGSWNVSAIDLHSAARFNVRAGGFRSNETGFRVVRSLFHI